MGLKLRTLKSFMLSQLSQTPLYLVHAMHFKNYLEVFPVLRSSKYLVLLFLSF